MNVFLAVIQDLFDFAHTVLFGSTWVKKSSQYKEEVLRYGDSSQPPLPTFASVGSLLQERFEPAEVIFHESKNYFVGEDEAFLYYEPVFAFDAVITPLSYGESVTLHKLGGRWAHVSTEIGEGWVLKDMLHETSDDVFPNLIENVEYQHNNPQTQKLRKCIKDEFYGERSGLPLTDAEFVTYKLREHSKLIPWTLKRPRVQGTWQQLLRGREGVYINIVPKVGVLIEYTHDDTGHVGYVEGVFSDGSISISSVGLIDEGVYTQELLTKDVWREMHPVFIEIK